MSYKIKIKTIDDNFLVFNGVKEYSIHDSMVFFIDQKTGLSKQFSILRADIEEER